MIWTKEEGMLTTFSQCNFSLEFPEILSQNPICYHWLSMPGNSNIMHFGILINMPYYFRVDIPWLYWLSQSARCLLWHEFSLSCLLGVWGSNTELGKLAVGDEKSVRQPKRGNKKNQKYAHSLPWNSLVMSYNSGYFLWMDRLGVQMNATEHMAMCQLSDGGLKNPNQGSS